MFNIITEVLIKSVISTALIAPGLFYTADNKFFNNTNGLIVLFVGLYVFVCFVITQLIVNWIKNR